MLYLLLYLDALAANPCKVGEKTLAPNGRHQRSWHLHNWRRFNYSNLTLFRFPVVPGTMPDPWSTALKTSRRPVDSDGSLVDSLCWKKQAHWSVEPKQTSETYKRTIPRYPGPPPKLRDPKNIAKTNTVHLRRDSPGCLRNGPLANV